VQDIGGKERKFMTNKVNYTSAPADVERSLDRATVASDLLPSPEELVRRSGKEKITIAIDKSSLELYKRYAKKHNAKYQTMINSVLGSYADKFLNK
jgi:uncharacterized protein (DUF4415 family)